MRQIRQVLVVLGTVPERYVESYQNFSIDVVKIDSETFAALDHEMSAKTKQEFPYWAESSDHQGLEHYDTLMKKKLLFLLPKRAVYRHVRAVIYTGDIDVTPFEKVLGHAHFQLVDPD